MHRSTAKNGRETFTRGRLRNGSKRNDLVENLPPSDASKARDAAGKAVAGRYSFTTWEEYVGERWDMDRTRSHRLIESALAAQKLENVANSQHLPSRESHVRELLKLEATAQPPRHAMHPRRLQSHIMHRSRYRAAQEPRAWGWVNSGR